MATPIDERIVAAKFDASDFEKGVDKTVKKLDELKKSLNLTDATKPIKELADKTEASTKSIGSSLEKLTERFTTFSGMIKQKILGGLAEEVANVFLTMERSVVGFIRSISTAQIGAGMEKYQNMLTSVRMMVNAGKDQSEVYEQLDRLQKYSDETSYSMEQMTDAMSKMVAAGVDLKDAERNVEGIANACAAAGINASDASRAYYNLSQAFSAGRLEYTDYRSLELLNLTTKEFKEQMLEAGVAAKTLTKEVKKNGDVVYKTSNKVDKKVKSGKVVNLNNFRDTLRYEWMNTDAMNQLFGGTYWMQMIDKEEIEKLRAELGDEEFERRFGKIASKAYDAAYEARSFLDVVNAIKDAVSSGWSKTFEYLFGQLDKAKEFFTALAVGPLASSIGKIAEYRNTVLGFWNGIEQEGGGGEVFRDTILKIVDALGTLLETFLQVLPGFDELDFEADEDKKNLKDLSWKIFQVSMAIRKFAVDVKDAAHRFNEFMNGPAFNKEGGPTRIELLRQALGNLMKVFGIAGKVISIAFAGITKAFDVLSPVFDGILVILEKITEPIAKLKEDEKTFSDIESSIDNILTVLKPVADALGQILGFAGEIAKFFVSMAIDTVTTNIQFFADVLGLIIELITGNSAQMEKGEGVLDRIKADFEGIKNACQEGINFVRGFFEALLGDIKELFGLTDEADKKAEGEEGGIFSGLTKFFQNNEFITKAKAWVDKAIVDVSNFIKSIPEKIKNLGVNIFTTIRSLFFEDQEVTENGKTETKTILTPLGEWVVQAADDIKAFFKSLPDRIITAVGKVGNWINEIFDYWFGGRDAKGQTMTVADDTTGGTKTTAAAMESRFDEFIRDVRKSISEWFNDLPNKIKKAFAQTGNFITRLYNVLDEFLFGKKVDGSLAISDGKRGKNTVKTDFYTATGRYKSGFSKWLDTVIKEIKKFIKDIPKKIKEGIKNVGDIVTMITNALFGKPEDRKAADSKDVEDKLKAPFLGINLSSILTTIGDIGKEIFNQFMRIFTGSEDIEENQKIFAKKIGEGIQWIRTKAEEAIIWVLKFVGNIPTMIANIFTGEGNGTSEEKGPIGQALSDFGSSIGKFIEELPLTLDTFINNAITEVDKLWNKLYKAIIGESEQEEALETGNIEDNAQQMIGESIGKRLGGMASRITSEDPALSPFQLFIKRLGETIKRIFETLPTWIGEGLDAAFLKINELIGGIGNWFKELNLKAEAEKMAEDMQKGMGVVTDSVKDASEKASDASKNLTGALDDVTGEKAKIDSGGEQEEHPLWTAIKRMAVTIYTIITETIPTAISEAFKWIGSQASLVWGAIRYIFADDVPEEESQYASQEILVKIRKFIKEELPVKLKTMWMSLTSFFKDVFIGVSNVFTGNVPENERQQTVTNIVTRIKDFLIKDLPAAISSLWNQAFGNGEATEAVEGDNQLQEAVVNAVEDQEKKANDQIEADNKKSGFWSFFETIGVGILTGLTKAFDWLGDIAGYIINALTGETSLADQIEEAYGEEKPEIRSALTKIGESLKKFFIETLPRLLGSAIGTVSKYASDFFGNLFGAVKDAQKTEADKANKQADQEGKNQGEEEAQGILNSFEGAFGFLRAMYDAFSAFIIEKDKSIIEVIVIIIAITKLLDKLSNLFSAADTIEATAKVVKWTTIGLAVLAVAGIMSYIHDIIQTDDVADTKYTKFMGVLDKLADVFTKIVWIVGLFTLKDVAGSVSDIISTLKGGGDDDGGFNFGESLLGSLSGAIGGFFKTIGLGAGGSIATGMVSTSLSAALEQLGDSVQLMTAEIENALSLLTPFIDQLYGMTDKLDTAIASVGKISTLINNFYHTFDEMYDDYYALDFTEAGENIKADAEANRKKKEQIPIATFFDNVRARMELITQTAMYVGILADALKKMEDVEDADAALDKMEKMFINDKFKNFLKNMLNFLKEAFDSSKLSAKSLGLSNDSLLPLYTVGVAAGLQILGAALHTFVEGVSGFDEKNVAVFEKSLDVFQKLADAIGEDKGHYGQDWISKFLEGNGTLAAIGTQIKLFGLSMKGFYGYVVEIPGFTDAEVKTTEAKIDALVHVVDEFAKIMDKTRYSSNFETYLKSMGEQLPSIGEAISQYLQNISKAFKLTKDDGSVTELTKENISSIVEVTKAVSMMMEALNLLYNTMIATGLEGTSLSDYFNTIFGTLNESVTGTMADPGWSDLIYMIYKGMLDALQREDFAKSYESVGETMASKMYIGIQNAFNEKYKPTITPVLNLETAKQQLVDFFGVGQIDAFSLSEIVKSAMNANDQTDEDRVRSSILTQQLTDIKTAVENGPTNAVSLSDITSAFGQMKIVVDKDVLAGEMVDTIDELIGRKIMFIKLGITPA